MARFCVKAKVPFDLCCDCLRLHSNFYTPTHTQYAIDIVRLLSVKSELFTFSSNVYSTLKINTKFSPSFQNLVFCGIIFNFDAESRREKRLFGYIFFTKEIQTIRNFIFGTEHIGSRFCIKNSNKIHPWNVYNLFPKQLLFRSHHIVISKK